LPRPRLDLLEEVRRELDVFDLAHGRLHAEFVLLEEVAELIAVDQIDRRRTVAGCLLLRMHEAPERGS
jgi:hypothetical protein